MDVEASLKASDKPFRSARLGLRIRSALVISTVLLGAVAAGVWCLHEPVHNLARQQDAQYGQQLAKTLGLAAEGYLKLDYKQRFEKLDKVVADMVEFQPVRYVAVLDSRGRVIASAGQQPGDDKLWQQRFSHVRPEHRLCRFLGDRTLVLARPILARDKVYWAERHAGSVQLVLDLTDSRKDLVAARRQFLIIGGTVVALSAVLAYLLVWQVLVRPIRHLADVTRQLAEGDFDARADLRRRDELGRLGWAFDVMAEHINAMRAKLLDHQRELEQTVEERTEELRHANGRLRAEMDDKEAFLRAVSHDLNAPLRNIAGMATMIVMKHCDELPEEVLARLQRIQGNVDRQSELIAELLELSRLTTCEDKRSPVAMQELLEGLVADFDFELQSRRIRARVHGPMPTLQLDANRIRQVFQNLIDNAIKYMHRSDGGRIELTWRREGSRHCFSVADNGPGIPSDQQEKIFTVFRRAHGSEDIPGKGVGLAVVRTVATKYGGRAEVHSTPGKGTTFTIVLDEACCPTVESLREEACATT